MSNHIQDWKFDLRSYRKFFCKPEPSFEQINISKKIKRKRRRNSLTKSILHCGSFWLYRTNVWGISCTFILLNFCTDPSWYHDNIVICLNVFDLSRNGERKFIFVSDTTLKFQPEQHTNTEMLRRQIELQFPGYFLQARQLRTNIQFLLQHPTYQQSKETEILKLQLPHKSTMSIKFVNAICSSRI